MFNKTQLILTTFTLTVAFQLILANRIRATPEEVNAAFKDLQNASRTLLINLTNAKFSMESDFFIQLDQEQIAALQQIDAKYNDTQQRLINITTNAQAIGLNVSSCLGNARVDIQNFTYDLKDKLQECIGRSLATAFDSLDAIWADIINYQENIITCTNRSILQCENYEEDDVCYGLVLNEIEDAKERLVDTLLHFRVVFLNILQAFRLPCIDMISNQIVVYPNLILNYVNNCVSMPTKLDIKPICH